jgi:ABC-type bacteriocin/lantibiotic exporter with double-glycine peptidase domain
MGALRQITRWSLERRGARFLHSGFERFQPSLDACGPTALADLLELTGRRVPSADSLRALTATTSEGTRIDALAAGAASAGLRLFEVRWDPEDFAKLPLPSLVWVERSHFVVVARRDRADSVDVFDPAAGHYRMAGNRFARIWSGAALIQLDGMSLRREPEDTSVSRPLRLRGTRATPSHATEV